MEIRKIPLTGSASLQAFIPDGAIGYKMYRRRPGIILAPGGAYLIYGTREGEAVALEFLARGYNVFVLAYSLGLSSREAKESGVAELDTEARYPMPVLEMLEAIHYLRNNGEQYNLDASRLFMMGFSAGAHLCASCGVHWNSPELHAQLSFTPLPGELKATGMLLGYPMINPTPERCMSINDPRNPDTRLVTEFLFQTQTPSQEQKDALNLTRQVTPETVPAFIWHSVNDPVVYAGDTTRFVLALQENDVSCEYHLFERGGHGLGLAGEVYARSPEEYLPDVAAWPGMADSWMKRQP